MTIQAFNLHFYHFSCLVAAVEVWGIASLGDFFHLSFDCQRHAQLCTDLSSTPLPAHENLRLCALLHNVLLGQPAQFPANAEMIKAGTVFQRQVWQVLSHIPHSETRTYGDIARQLGNPRLARAVGQACNKNPLPLIIPCHRVVASQGIGGFAGGTTVKQQLLAYERQWREKRNNQARAN